MQGWAQKVPMPPYLSEGRRCGLQAPHKLSGNPHMIQSRVARGKRSCAGDSLGWHFIDRRLFVWLFPGRDLALTQSEVQRAARVRGTSPGLGDAEQ